MIYRTGLFKMCRRKHPGTHCGKRAVGSGKEIKSPVHGRMRLPTLILFRIIIRMVIRIKVYDNQVKYDDMGITINIPSIRCFARNYKIRGAEAQEEQVNEGK